jgi:hypothetical protein
MAFILDPSSVNEIYQLYQGFEMQVLEIVFSMCRTYAYGLHRKMLILVGKWPYATRDENCNFKYQINSPIVAGTMPRTPAAMCDVPLAASHPTDPSHDQTSPYNNRSELCNFDELPSECLTVAHVPHPVLVPALLHDHGQPADRGASIGGDSGLTGGDSGLTGGDSGLTGGDSGQPGGESGQTGGEAYGVAAVSLSFSSHKYLTLVTFS